MADTTETPATATTAILFPGQGSQTLTGAFHSPMMASAVPDFTAALERVEVGPGRVLTGLVKRTLRAVELVSA
jgi:malonyl CoA-acyl carrier protein transacylase